MMYRLGVVWWELKAGRLPDLHSLRYLFAPRTLWSKDDPWPEED